MITQQTMTRRILRTFDRATSSDLEAGARWYDEAGQLAADLAGFSVPFDMEVTTAQVAVIIAHLSPRTSWSRNVAGATGLLRTGEAPACIGDNVERATASLEFADPFTSFGRKALKTRNFAANILGDREAVTVDVWAARVAGVTEAELKLVGVYDTVAHAYRLAARARGVDPATMQAVTWVVARNGRAA